MSRAIHVGLLLLCGAHLGFPSRVAAQDPPAGQYTTTVLMRDLSNPTEMAFLPDGRIYVARKSGVVLMYNPVSNQTTTAATLSIAGSGNLAQREDGLLSLVLDPNFAANRWTYLLFSNLTRDSVSVARFLSDSATGNLNLASRQTLLGVAFTINSSTAEHNTGHMAFGPDGNLYIGFGDNTQNLSGSVNGAGYSPRDPARPLFDAQRTAANTNDLRGKILRIRPEANGTYSIPSGNLFPPGTPNTRPEIYAMGLRHPFRISVDRATGWVYWAEPGPNATADNVNQGPKGYEEINLARTPGNYGWPYCAANNQCYTQYNYQTGAGGPTYKADSLRNTSVNNTGITDLPPGRPALAWYAYSNPAGTAAFPIFGTCSSNCNTAMVGPVYNYSNTLESPSKLPSVFHRHLFVLEWVRSNLYVATLDSAGQISALRAFRLGRDSTMNSPIDMKIGPDGALYFLNWVTTSSGYGYPSNQNNGTLTRLAYTGPHVPISVDPRREQAGAAGGHRRDFLLVASPGGSFTLPAGAARADFYSLRGERLWSLQRGEAAGRQEYPLPDRAQGVVRVKLHYR